MLKNPVTSRSSLSLILLSLVCFSGSGSAGSPVYEKPLTIDIGKINSTSLKKEHYEIDPMVMNDGRINRYRILSPVQNIEAYGDELLLERQNEIEAIVALRQIKDSDAYSKGLEQAANVPLTLTRNTIEDPVGTLEAIPGGVGNLLDDLGAALNGMGKGQKTDSQAMLKDLVGFNTVKRRLASDFGVDPYSTNKLLQTELDDVAWAMFAGGATIDAMMAAAPMAASLTVRAADRAKRSQTDWKIPPATVIQAAEQQVTRMGLSPQEATKLLYHPVCSFNHLTPAVAAMSSTTQAAGRDEFFRTMTLAKDEHECRHFRTLAELLHHYHINIAPLSSIQVNGKSVSARNIQGQSVLPINADYFLWTHDNAQLAGIDKSHWVLTGYLSSQSRQQANRRNITLHENVLKTSTTRIDTMKVLVPERIPDETAVKQNKTGQVVDDLSTGIGNTLNGILGGFNGQNSNNAEQAEPGDTIGE